MVENDLLQYFREKYPDFIFGINTYNLTDREKSLQLLGELYQGLPHEHGGICAFRRGPEKNYTGHCIILYKNRNGENLLLDVQARELHSGDDDIIRYFDNNNIIQINTLSSNHKKYGYQLRFWLGEKGSLRRTAKHKKTKRKKTKRKKTKRKKTKRKKTKRKKHL